jgi:hypothetical protein
LGGGTCQSSSSLREVREVAFAITTVTEASVSAGHCAMSTSVRAPLERAKNRKEASVIFPQPTSAMRSSCELFLNTSARPLSASAEQPLKFNFLRVVSADSVASTSGPRASHSARESAARNGVRAKRKLRERLDSSLHLSRFISTSAAERSANSATSLSVKYVQPLRLMAVIVRTYPPTKRRKGSIRSLAPWRTKSREWKRKGSLKMRRKVRERARRRKRCGTAGRCARMRARMGGCSKRSWRREG